MDHNSAMINSFISYIVLLPCVPCVCSNFDQKYIIAWILIYLAGMTECTLGVSADLPVIDS